MDCLQWICCLNNESAFERNALVKNRQATPAASSINGNPAMMQDPAKYQQPAHSEEDRQAMIATVYKNLLALPKGSYHHFPQIAEDNQEQA